MIPKKAQKMKKMKTIKGIFLLTTVMLMALCACAQTSITTQTPTNIVLDYDLSRVDSNLKPGDSGILQVTIKNTGTQAAENVQVFIPETSSIKINKRWEVGHIDGLTSKTLSTTMSVSKDASIGLNSVQVRVTFDGFDRDGDRENNQVAVLELPIRVYGNANFQVEIEGRGIFFKDATNQIVVLGTTKDGARDVSGTLSSTCASVVGSTKSYVGTLGKNESFMMRYSIRPMEIGTCTLSLLMDYSDSSGNPLNETLSLGIDVQRRDVDFKVVDVAYQNISPGTVSLITVKIENVGSDTAKDVTFSMGFSDPFTAVGSSEKYVSEIKGDQIVSIQFQVVIDAAADIKAYSVPLSIEYYDSSGSASRVNKSLGISVDGKPEIKIVLDEAALFAPGSRGKVTAEVVNKGFAEVKFLNIRLLPTDDYDVLSSSEVYIGNLDSDSTDTQEFEIQVKNIAPGKIPLKFEARYKEKNSNIDHVETFDVELSVLSLQELAQRQSGTDIGSLIMSIGGIVIGLFLLIILLWLGYKVLVAVIGFLDRRLFKKK